MKVLLRVWDLFFLEGSVVLFQMTLGMMKMKVSHCRRRRAVIDRSDLSFDWLCENESRISRAAK